MQSSGDWPQGYVHTETLVVNKASLAKPACQRLVQRMALNPGATLVHCVQGHRRSATAACALFASLKKVRLDECRRAMEEIEREEERKRVPLRKTKNSRIEQDTAREGRNADEDE